MTAPGLRTDERRQILPEGRRARRLADAAPGTQLVYVQAFRRALVLTLSALPLPGLGLAALRRRGGTVIFVLFLLAVVGAVVAIFTLPRNELLHLAVTPGALVTVSVVCLVIALAWALIILRTWLWARPARLTRQQEVLGVGLVVLLSAVVTAPLAFVARTADIDRSLVTSVFSAKGSGDLVRSATVGGVAADVWKQPRLNILLIGSDAGPGRTGMRSDTMMEASIDTSTGRAALIGIPRNLERAKFPPGSAAAAKFPQGFHDPANSASQRDNYLLNAMYEYGQNHPDVLPRSGPEDPGVRLLASSIGYMTGLPIDYYALVNMQGFSALIDAVGGVDVYVPEKLITPGGPYHSVLPPFIQKGSQHMDGDQALAFARSRHAADPRSSAGTDYDRMTRQRCVLSNVLQQKSPLQLLASFPALAEAAQKNIFTDIPQDLLAPLARLAEKTKNQPLGSLGFSPEVKDPNSKSGYFDVTRADVPFMQKAVAAVIAPPAASTPSTPAPSGSGSSSGGSTPAPSTTSSSGGAATAGNPPLASACNPPA